jgi:hypothetical protein
MPVRRPRLTLHTLEDRTVPAVHAVGGETVVATLPSAGRALPAVAAADNGDYVVAWESDGEDGDGWVIRAQRFNAAGAAQGPEFTVNTHAASDQRAPTVAMDADGDFVIARRSVGQDGSGDGV